MAHSAAGLSQSASMPQLGGKTPSASSRNNLADIGASISMGNMTTSLYYKMQDEGLFRRAVHDDHIRPAGRSIVVPLADSAERDVQSDIYFPAPPTPVRERRFRKISHGPGEIHVHYGLKDQKLPGEDFRYGVRGCKGQSTEDCMKAGQLFGVAEYKNSVAERIYESNKKEPLAKPYTRGHNLKMLPEGFGNPSGEFTDGKFVIFPVEMKPDSEEARQLYKRTHHNYLPGERINRNYNFPEETKGENFRFGKDNFQSAEGVGAKAALSMQNEDDGTLKRTKFVQRASEDYRNVAHCKIGKRTNLKQGSAGPPMPPGHRYGVKSISSDFTARSCILGYYPLEAQLPDQDLGCCTKPGRRNVTMQTRAFGVPSVRTDVPAPPPGRKSVADPCNYGDECGAAALLGPQRFDNKGVPDSDFLIRRTKEELRSLIESCSYDLGEDFDELFEEAVNLFDDGVPLVSLDAILYLHNQQIDAQVSRRLTASASAPMIRA